jgi:hypothetical protein
VKLAASQVVHNSIELVSYLAGRLVSQSCIVCNDDDFYINQSFRSIFMVKMYIFCSNNCFSISLNLFLCYDLCLVGLLKFPYKTLYDIRVLVV